MQTHAAIESGGTWLCESIQKAIDESQGLAVGKLGTSELELLVNVLSQTPLHPRIVHNALYNAGLWPRSELESWVFHMIYEVLPYMDGMVEWNVGTAEKDILNEYSPKSFRMVLRALEPYYQSKPDKQWTSVTPSHIAVMSPFSKSISIQVQKGLSNVWEKQPNIWSYQPKVSTIRTGCSPALDTTGPAAWSPSIIRNGWKAAVEDSVSRVLETDAHFILVGCGALSLPIVAALKKAGRIAIHLGGATQILFGIRGRRWDTHSIISKFYGSAWISPSIDERPQNASHIEGGCYW